MSVWRTKPLSTLTDTPSLHARQPSFPPNWPSGGQDLRVLFHVAISIHCKLRFLTYRAPCPPDRPHHCPNQQIHLTRRLDDPRFIKNNHQKSRDPWVLFNVAITICWRFKHIAPHVPLTDQTTVQINRYTIPSLQAWRHSFHQNWPSGSLDSKIPLSLSATGGILNLCPQCPVMTPMFLMFLIIPQWWLRNHL